MANKAKVQKVSVDGMKVSVFYPSLKKGVSVDIATFSNKLIRAAAVHGVKQRLGDAESGGSAAEKYEMAQRIIAEAFEQDSWELTTRVVDPKLVIQAMATVKDVSEAAVREALEKAGEGASEKLKEWRQHPKVKAEILKIQAANASKAAAETDEDDEPSLD